MSDTNETENEPNNVASEGTSPDFKHKIGAFDIAVWGKEVSTEDGRTYMRHDIALRKSWMKDGEWKESKIRMNPEDAMKIVRLIEHAYDSCYDQL